MINRSQEINSNLGKLFLRISIGGLMIFHGISKFIYGHDFIKQVLVEKGLPESMWLGVPVGEVIAPLCIILGVFTRVSSLILAFTMLMTLYLVHGWEGFLLTETGGPAVELNLFYLLTSISLFLLGPGNYRIYKGNNPILV
ncbi:DoxX family protein [Apibacter muscae]|uniref:DoxX family protein n=1 Tax=Apibacter muscae TaxID=2509004 RepID=A0A563DK74_9FLAO|nr:DoxX family protein [Apibacter muscae]TWP30557.1 DoxX family protein [Apibacter muscae]TWP31393.1 DoxX family protein [Apibacter muscae]